MYQRPKSDAGCDRRFEPPESKRELVLAWHHSFPRGEALQDLARALRGSRSKSYPA